jgi:hypothetical protein
MADSKSVPLSQLLSISPFLVEVRKLRAARDSETRAALHSALLPELIVLVCWYDRRPAQRWCRDSVWLPTEGLQVADDRRSVEADRKPPHLQMLAVRGTETFAVGARHWRIRIPMCDAVWAGVVDVRSGRT